MQFYELAVTVYLQVDTPYNAVNELIAININRAMFLDEALAQLHKENKFKNYVFSGFYPIEQDKIYKAGRVYVFKIRSFDREFIKKLKVYLKRITKDFQVLATELVVQRYRFISELITITPALATVEGRHWVSGDDIALLQSRIQNNLLRKYEAFFGESLDLSDGFIQGIEILNKKPMALKYKKIKMIGNKIKVAVKEDEVSQKLAFVALANGILEKNSSLGMGYCVAK